MISCDKIGVAGWNGEGNADPAFLLLGNDQKRTQGGRLARSGLQGPPARPEIYTRQGNNRSAPHFLRGLLNLGGFAALGGQFSAPAQKNRKS